MKRAFVSRINDSSAAYNTKKGVRLLKWAKQFRHRLIIGEEPVQQLLAAAKQYCTQLDAEFPRTLRYEAMMYGQQIFICAKTKSTNPNELLRITIDVVLGEYDLASQVFFNEPQEGGER